MTNVNNQNKLSFESGSLVDSKCAVGASSPEHKVGLSLNRDKLAKQLCKLASIYQRIAEIISGKSSSVEGERVRLGKEAVEILNALPGGYGLNGLDLGSDGELVELRLRCAEAEGELNHCLLGQRKVG